MDSSISQVFAGYNFNQHIGLQFNLPVIYRSYKRPDGAGGIERGTVAGIGDSSLLLNLVPIQKFSEKFTFNGVCWQESNFRLATAIVSKRNSTKSKNPLAPQRHPRP